jgi:hypothetical protein
VRRLPIVWGGVFAVFTVCCLLLASFANSSVGRSVRPQRGDNVIFVAARGDAACPAGSLQTGQVVAESGDRVRSSTVKADGVKLPFAGLFVNGRRVAAVSRSSSVLTPFTVARGETVVLSHGPACKLGLVATMPISSIVGYGTGTTGARVEAVRQQLQQRIFAEKYVAGVYLLVTAFFGLWLFIHAGRISRLQHQADALSNAAGRQRSAVSKS